MERWMGRWMEGLVGGYKDRWWMCACLNDGWMDGWIGGWMGGWVVELLFFPP